MKPARFDTDNRPKGVWVNQPSTLQPGHDRHGELGYGVREWDRGGGPSEAAHFFPLDPLATSMRIHASALCEGWPPHLIAEHTKMIAARYEGSGK